MNSAPEISIVIPVFNEAENLEELIKRCLAVCRRMSKPFEIILVDDGSFDRSADMITEAAAQHPGEIVSVFFNRNYGQHAAVIAGFAQIRGSIVVTLDADLQNPPEEIPRLIKQIEAGSDVVGSIRLSRQDTLFRRWASALINLTIQKATGIHMKDYGCMLRAYRRPIVDAMLQCQERSTFIPVLANRFARKTSEIEVRHDRRSRGESKYSLWKLINLQFDLMTSMTTFPLRLLSFLGILVSCSGIGLGVFLLIMRLVFGTVWAVEGVFTLFAVLFVFIGALFIGLGLLGEYLGRVYNEVRARPRYFIHHIVGRPEGGGPALSDSDCRYERPCESPPGKRVGS
jgi:undecaprenyl-phosphate 4-deoxy-4-formamido-L-arabinose transferase